MLNIYSENIPHHLSPHAGEVVTMLHGLDADGLYQYAARPSMAPEPVKMLTEVAFETSRPLSNRSGEIVLRDVGYQLDPAAEREASPEMALFLRRSTGEGVYPHIISAKDSWELAAEALAITGKELSPLTARFLLLCAGVQGPLLMEAVGMNANKLGNYATAFIRTLYRQAEQQQQLGDKTAAVLLPLVLPDVPEAPHRTQQLRHLADRLFDKATASSFMDASSDRQQEVIDVMSLRYLDRPRSIMPQHNPWDLVQRIRYYSQGHRVSELAEASRLGWPAFRKALDHMETHFRESLSAGDIDEIQQFLSGNSSQVVLQRSQPLDAAFTNASMQRREAYNLHRKSLRRAARHPVSGAADAQSRTGRNSRPSRPSHPQAGLGVHVPESRIRLDTALTQLGSALGLEGRDIRSLARFIDILPEQCADAAKKLDQLLTDIAPDAQKAMEKTELSDLHRQVAKAFFGLDVPVAQSPATLMSNNPELGKSLERAKLTPQLCLAMFCEDWLKKL